MADWETFLNIGLILIGLFVVVRHLRDLIINTPRPSPVAAKIEDEGENEKPADEKSEN